MNFIEGVISFFLEYYALYLWLIPALISAFFIFHLLIKRKRMSIRRKVTSGCFLFLACVLMCLLCARFIHIGMYGLLAAFAMGFLLGLGVYELIQMKWESLLPLYKENCWGILFFLILFIDFLFNKSDHLATWGSCWYGTDYSMGMGSRFLIGTILSILTRGRVSSGIAYFFCEIVLLLLIICVSFLANALIRSTNGEERIAVIFLILCFLSCPGAIAGFWTEANMGRMETYTLLITLGSIILFDRIGSIRLKYSCLAVLGIISTAIYQGFIFLYFPLIFTVIICDIFKDEIISKLKIMYGIICCLVIGIAFIWFQFFSYVNYSSASEMAEAIREKSDIYVNELALHYEFFASISEAYNDLNILFLTGTEYPREKTLLVLLIFLPIGIILSALYSLCLRESKKNMGRAYAFKTPYIYCLLSNFIVLPQFILNVDWGRWMTALVFNLFFEVFYLYHAYGKEMRAAIQRLSLFIRENKPLAVMCVLYFTVFDKFGSREYLPQIENFWQRMSMVLGIK